MQRIKRSSLNNAEIYMFHQDMLLDVNYMLYRDIKDRLQKNVNLSVIKPPFEVDEAVRKITR